jgi:hypothetical protein
MNKLIKLLPKPLKAYLSSNCLRVNPVNLANFSASYVDKTISFYQRSANHLCPSVIERKPKPLKRFNPIVVRIDQLLAA